MLDFLKAIFVSKQTPTRPAPKECSVVKELVDKEAARNKPCRKNKKNYKKKGKKNV